MARTKPKAETPKSRVRHRPGAVTIELPPYLREKLERMAARDAREAGQIHPNLAATIRRLIERAQDVGGPN